MSTDAAARARRAPAGDGLIIVGLVGRAGSGKSTVARVFEEGGAKVLEADALGHEVTDRDPEVREALIADYGPQVYRPDGALDRAKVAARVFRDPASLARLNALVHPRIVQRARERIAAWRDGGFRGVVVFDAALMLAWGFERECDAVVAVIAPEGELVARLVASRGWSEADARARLAAQPAQEAYAAAADLLIDNRAGLDELTSGARAALGRLAAVGGKRT
jgi:dephospho-CoA kinase